MKNVTGIAVIFVLALCSHAKADSFQDLENVAVIGGLAPECGTRPAQWGADLLQSTSGTIQAIFPSSGMMPSDDTMKQWQKAQAMIGAAYFAGGELFDTYKQAACKNFIDPVLLSTGDSLVAGYRQTSKEQIVDPTQEAGIPNAALPIAWTLSRADLAALCHIKSSDWADIATSAGMTPLGQAAFGPNNNLSDDEQTIAMAAATNAYIFDESIAKAEFDSPNLTACNTLKHETYIKTLGSHISAANANGGPWANVKP